MVVTMSTTNHKAHGVTWCAPDRYRIAIGSACLVIAVILHLQRENVNAVIYTINYSGTRRLDAKQLSYNLRTSIYL